MSVEKLSDEMWVGVKFQSNAEIAGSCLLYTSLIKAACVINAGGVYADGIARLAGDESFTIHPRRGEYILDVYKRQVSKILILLK